jgi:hypothetical protein
MAADGVPLRLDDPLLDAEAQRPRQLRQLEDVLALLGRLLVGLDAARNPA